MQRQWQVRWFVLKENKLSYYRDRSHNDPAGVIDLSIAHIKVSSLDRVNTFEVIVPDRTYSIQAENSSDFFFWVEILRKSIQQHNYIFKQNLPVSVSIGSNNDDININREKIRQDLQTMQRELEVEYSGNLVKRGASVKVSFYYSFFFLLIKNYCY